jgi:hypothetical protein
MMCPEHTRLFDFYLQSTNAFYGPAQALKNCTGQQFADDLMAALNAQLARSRLLGTDDLELDLLMLRNRLWRNPG